MNLYVSVAYKMPTLRNPQDPYWRVVTTQMPSPDLTKWIADRIFRHDKNSPGFACIRFQESIHSFQLRLFMANLKQQLSLLFKQSYGEELAYYSLGRFDQKKTTRLHLDGAPACSFLMLGYEPSLVKSRFLIADYATCAQEQTLTPRQFLDQKNPMFNETGQSNLKAYTQIINEWDDSESRVVIINNGSLPSGQPWPGFGVLHGADILHVPDAKTPRIINSILFAPKSETFTESELALNTFLHTDSISGQIL